MNIPDNHCYIGIKPGLTGAAVAIIDTQYREKFEVYDWKDIETAAQALWEWGFKYKVKAVVLEDVTFTPAQDGQGREPGHLSTFKFGENKGIWRGLCAELKVNAMFFFPILCLIRPRNWKKQLGIPADKNRAVKIAIELYPEAKNFLTRKKDHNRAEALLLAHYGRL